MEFTAQFAGQQIFAQVVGAPEIRLAATNLIARLNINDEVVINVHLGNNVEENFDEGF